MDDTEAPSGDVIGSFVQELTERLYLGDSTVLIGKPQLDKTSAISQVLTDLRKHGCYTMEIDLLNVTSIEELGHLLMQKILDYDRGNLGIDWEDALLSAQYIAKRDNKQMVITFHEWQEVERLGGETLLKQLRSIIQHQSNVTYLFVGSDPIRMKIMFADNRQAFYRFATILYLP